MEGQLALGEEATPRRTPQHHVEVAGQMLGGMAVGSRWPTWERVPQSVREVAVEQARRALDAIAEAAYKA